MTHHRTPFVLGIAVATLAACELAEPNDVTGNFEVAYADNLRVYINDELVAEVVSGEDATVEHNGETFEVSTLCSDEGVDCPAETFWGTIAVDQPWGSDYQLLNFVNLDPELGVAGQRIGGLLEDDGSFAMLSGLALDGNDACTTLGVGVVTGVFAPDNSAIEDGVITYEWSTGCEIGGVELGGTLRIETDYTASRTGDYDISSVEADAPVDEEGAEVDPEAPDEGQRFETTAGLVAR